MRKQLLLLFLCLVMVTGISAQTATAPAVGDGTAGSPYEIANVENLFWLTQTTAAWNKFFIQTADIDVSDSKNWNGGAGFTAIGTSSKKFTGNYNGQSHTVSGIFISSKSDDYFGLFGYSDGATIANVGVVNVDILGDDWIGGLVGYANGGTVTSCYALNVKLESNDDYIGGLIGQATNTNISSCYSSGTVTAGDDRVGGLVGYCRANLNNCYSTANVIGDSYVGGLVGYSYSGFTYTNCYSIGSVTGATNTGGFSGNSSSTVVGGYYNTETSGMSDSGNGEPRKTAEMLQQATFVGWDFTTIWQIIEGASYPGLRSLPDAVVAIAPSNKVIKINIEYTETLLVSAVDNQAFTLELVKVPAGMILTGNVLSWTPTHAGDTVVEYKVIDANGIEINQSYSILVTSLAGEGTETSPFEINSLASLKELSEAPIAWSYYYIQTADINAAATKTWNSGAGFSPIGNESRNFTGFYNAKGHTIDSLYIDRSKSDYVGLFGYIQYGAVDSIAITNSTIIGSDYVGALSGRLHAANVTNSYVSGTVTGVLYVGGITGRNWDGILANCYSTAGVVGTSQVGGLVGEYKGNINYCYATGSVYGKTNTGGLVGNDAAAGAYAVTSSYYNAEAGGQNDTGKGEARTTAEMLQDTTFAGWPIDSLWVITNGVTFPRLKTVNNGPILLATATKLTRANFEFKDTIQVIAMDNQTVILSLVKKPTGMIITGDVISWTPTQTGAFSVEIKAVDGAGLVSSYAYTLTVITMDGVGTKENPFQISSIDELKQLSETSSIWNKYFIQTADIDASAASGFSPIGTSSLPFSGTYNAKGNTISGLTINLPNSTYIGLFGYTNGAKIDSIRLVNSYIAGQENVAALVGYSDASTISNCYTNAAVTGLSNVGGLVGYASGSTISKCYTDGMVNGVTWIDPDYGITIKPTYIGGLVGNLRKLSTIDYSYSTAAVDGELANGYYVGGLVGYQKGASVFNSYATGPVTGARYIGGFVGSAELDGSDLPKIEYCYSVGLVTASYNRYFGGFDGYFAYQTATVSCYFDMGASEQLTSDDGKPRTTAEMLQQTTFVGWDFTTVWGMVEGTSYPALLTVSNNAPFAFADTLDVAGSSSVVGNDYDFETGQASLVTKIVTAPKNGELYDNIYRFNDGTVAGTKDSLYYRVGEVMADGSILWGNSAKAVFTKIANTAPVISAVANKSTNENTPIAITLADITATDVDGDNLFVVITAGANFTTVSPTVIVPADGFYGELNVGIAVNDGNMNSDTLNMVITVVAVPDVTDITWATPSSVTYGNAIGASVMNAQTSSVGTLAYSFTADSIFNAGVYELKVTFTPTEAQDYTTASNTVMYTVEQAMLTATAADKSVIQGLAIPELTITYSGFVNSETVSVIDVVPTAATTATSTSAAGTYDITVSGGSDNNYAFTYVKGMLTIVERVVSLSVSELQIEAADNSTATFDITSNIGWSISSTETWLTASPVNGTENAAITLTAAANTATVSRMATVTVSGEGVEDKTIVVTQDAFVGINENGKLAISVYPNPSSDVVNVTLPVGVENAVIELYNITGAKIEYHNATANISKIDVSHLENGVYMFHIISGNNTSIISWIKE